MAYQILVVDDEKLIVKGIKFSLEQDGMEVTPAYDGEEAMQYIKERPFDLVVLDVMLPKMDGLQVCQQTREFSQVPIIMVTAKGEDMDKIMGLTILMILLFLAIAALIVINLFTVKKVKVTGNEHYSDEAMKDWLLDDEYSWNSLYVYFKYKFVEPREMPFSREALQIPDLQS